MGYAWIKHKFWWACASSARNWSKTSLFYAVHEIVKLLRNRHRAGNYNYFVHRLCNSESFKICIKCTANFFVLPLDIKGILSCNMSHVYPAKCPSMCASLHAFYLISIHLFADYYQFDATFFLLIEFTMRMLRICHIQNCNLQGKHLCKHLSLEDSFPCFSQECFNSFYIVWIGNILKYNNSSSSTITIQPGNNRSFCRWYERSYLIEIVVTTSHKRTAARDHKNCHKK